MTWEEIRALSVSELERAGGVGIAVGNGWKFGIDPEFCTNYDYAVYDSIVWVKFSSFKYYRPIYDYRSWSAEDVFLTFKSSLQQEIKDKVTRELADLHAKKSELIDLVNSCFA